METRKDLLAIVSMVAAITLFFLPVLLPGKIYFYRDVIFFTYPLSAIVKECFDKHVWPLWNPYIGFGQPLLASPNAQVIYPTTLLRMLLPGPVAFKWHVILHTWWAAVGMFLLCRRFKMARTPALLGGLGFVFAGPFVSYMNYHMQVASAAWLPWVFLALDRALSSWSARRCLIFGGLLALQFLTCEAVTSMQTITLSFLYAAVIFGNWRKPFAQENYRILATFFIAGIFSMLLSAVYLLPFLRYISLGRRSGGLTSDEANHYSFHPLLSFDLIVPRLLLFNPFGAGDTNPWVKTLSQGGAPFFLCLYLGVAQCGLALLGAVWGKERRRFFTIVAVVTLLLAFGGYVHLFDLLRWTVPIFRMMRYPIKFLLITSFAVSLLAAYGLEQLRQPATETCAAMRRQGLLLLLALSVLLLLLPALYFSVLPLNAYETLQSLAARAGVEDATLAASQLWDIARSRFLRSLIVLIIPLLLAVKMLAGSPRAVTLTVRLILIITVLELGLANFSANPVTSERFALFRPELLNYFPSPSADYRICPNEGASPGVARPQMLPNQEPGAETSLYYARSLMVPYDNITYQVYTGIDNDKEGLYPHEYLEVKQFIDRAETSDEQLTRLLGNTNTRFVVSQHDLGKASGLRHVGAAFNFSVEPTQVYEIEGYLPQTYVATRQVYLPAGQTTIERLASAQFSKEEVILNDMTAPRLEASDIASGSSATSRIIERTLRSFVVEAQLNKPGYLVALHSCVPGWRVVVDGRPARIYRANQLFMALPLPPGRHRVEFSYLPTEVLLGLAISLLTLAGAIVWVLYPIKR